jgi:hypothetical protein
LQEALLESKVRGRQSAGRNDTDGGGRIQSQSHRGIHHQRCSEASGLLHTRPWNDHRDDFIAALEVPEVAQVRQAATAAADAFKAPVRELTDKLKEFRNGLSLSMGVPIVDRLTARI